MLSDFVYEETSTRHVLERKDNIRDLRIIFDSKFSFNNRIIDVIEKAYKMFGFIYRNCRDFTNITTLTQLFYALVRSRLEYGAIIWYPLFNRYLMHSS